MSKEKQILQLFREGHSQRKIAGILGVSRNTMAKVIKAYQAQGIAAEKWRNPQAFVSGIH